MNFPVSQYGQECESQGNRREMNFPAQNMKARSTGLPEGGAGLQPAFRNLAREFIPWRFPGGWRLGGPTGLNMDLSRLGPRVSES
jgi:hypothetical protein